MIQNLHYENLRAEINKHIEKSLCQFVAGFWFASGPARVSWQEIEIGSP
jgi:hypothetical protein